MSNEAANALSALGIATPATDEAAVVAANTVSAEPTTVTTTVTVGGEAPVTTTEVTKSEETQAAEAAVATPAAKEEPAFAAGDISDLSFDTIPEQKRAFTGGGKTIYGIEEIAAPGTDGKKYHAKLVAYKDGDVVAFKRSVQSSATGQNKKAKEAGAPNYYITRSHEVEGKFVGVIVLRTDERPADEAAEQAEQQSAE